MVTSTQGAVTKPWNRCCRAPAFGTAAGLRSTDPAALAFAAAPGRCDLPNIAQTSLSPFPVVIEVRSPQRCRDATLRRTHN